MRLIFSLVCILLISVSCGKDKVSGQKSSQKSVTVSIKSRVQFFKEDPSMLQILDSKSETRYIGRRDCHVSVDKGILKIEIKNEKYFGSSFDPNGTLTDTQEIKLLKSGHYFPLGDYLIFEKGNNEVLLRTEATLTEKEIEIRVTCTVQ